MSILAEKTVPLLDLKAQHVQIRDEVLSAVTRVIDDQKFILGEEVESFEAEIAQYTGARYAIGCASGSDALTLALMAAGIGPGDRVVTTPYTFFATAGAISRGGAIPVFADIEPDTFNLDPSKTESACKSNGGVRAIIPVHLFGAAADMAAFVELGKRYNAFVIEDAAQAVGAEYNGRPVGSFGHIGCFSFFPSKNLGAYGDGGLLTTQDAALAAHLKALRIHGRTGKYIHDWIGINSRLDALQAAVLRVKLRYLDSWSDRRSENADIYRKLLADRQLPITLPNTLPYQTRHIYNQFVIRCESRDELQAYLKKHGIGTEVYYPVPLHLQKCFSDLGYKAGDFPVSEKLAAEALALPVHPELSVDQIEYICSTIGKFYQ